MKFLLLTKINWFYDKSNKTDRNVGEYVVFIQNMTHNGMNRAFIKNGVNFQNIRPIEGILKNGIESDNRVNPTNENNNSVYTINDSALDNDTPLEKEYQDNIDNIDLNVMEIDLQQNYDPDLGNDENSESIPK